jgi:hypothetical protein
VFGLVRWLLCLAGLLWYDVDRSMLVIFDDKRAVAVLEDVQYCTLL